MRAEKERERRNTLGDVYREKERERNKNEKRKEQKRINTLNWKRKNKEYLKIYRKSYREQRSDKVKAWDQNKRARIMNAGKLTPQEWGEILEKYDYSCYYCHKKDEKLEQEHRTPLVRGGKHNSQNVVPACRECNARKFTKTEEEFRNSGILK